MSPQNNLKYLEKSQRLIIAIPGEVYRKIEEQSRKEGRSMCNLVSFLIESTLISRKSIDHREN